MFGAIHPGPASRQVGTSISERAESRTINTSSRQGQCAIAMAGDMEHGLILADRTQLPAVQAVARLQ
ncbi:hypothetical protein D3C75_1105350 [compost metagenome]